MKVIVCGSRNSEQKDHIFKRLDDFHSKTPITFLIEGGQRKWCPKARKIVGGVDFWAHEWARSRKIRVWTERADWKRFGKGAGPIRNLEMLVKHKPEAVITFPGGAGTANMIRQAGQNRVQVVRLA